MATVCQEYGPLSGTTQVSRYQKGKTNLDFTEARDSEWQWHQLGHKQVCTSLQTDNHASTSPLSFYRPDALLAAQPTASKHGRQTYVTGKWAELLQTHFSTADVCHDNEHHSTIRLTCIASSISRPVGFFAREISRRNIGR